MSWKFKVIRVEGDYQVKLLCETDGGVLSSFILQTNSNFGVSREQSAGHICTVNVMATSQHPFPPSPRSQFLNRGYFDRTTYTIVVNRFRNCFSNRISFQWLRAARTHQPRQSATY